MALDPDASTQFSFILRAYGFYAQLIQAASGGRTSGSILEPGLGGKLLYAGELDKPGRSLVVAANILGAASLTATADPAAQKQAVRDGVVDFLVTSLDEALRILKNEIRKCQAVAVCVGAAPEAVEREMRERGVRPDLLRPGAPAFTCCVGPHAQGARGSDASGPAKIPALVTWTVASAPSQWLPRLDAIALDCLQPDAWPARRWLRFAPRYLGRPAHGMRLLYSDREFAASFIEQVRQRVGRAEIGVAVKIQATFEGGGEEHHFSPPRSSNGAALS